MTFYANIQDNKINGGSSCKCVLEGLTQIEITEELFNNIEKCILEDGKVIIDPDYDTKKAKEDRKAEIKYLLAELDLKSIRAMRSNDTEYIEKYENEAKTLREELNNL